MTHICHLVYSFDVGGLERVIVNCVNGLDSTRYSHTIIALTSVGAFIHEIKVPVQHHSLNKKPGLDLSIYPRLFNLLRVIKPDVLHTYNLATLEYQWVGLLSRVPVRIHAEHGRDSYDPNGTVKKYQLLRRICSYAVHHFVAVSEDLANWLTNVVKVPADKTRLLVNGIDTRYFSRSDDVTLISEGFTGKFVFGHVARMHPIKNQRLMIRAFKQACIESSSFAEKCVLVFVGDGPEKKQLESLVESDEALKGKICFEGSKSNVRDYYRVFDVFLMSSLAEGIPMTLLESMAMAVPHLVTNVGGIAEVTLPGVTGLSVESEDIHAYTRGMITLFENADKRKKMAKNARNRVVESYDQSVVISRYSELYQGKV